jgi:antibiotic biosynthesis monooxygenase (ABM) superfamily enzyme
VTFRTLASIATVCNVVLFGYMIIPVATSFNSPPGAQ